MTPADVLAAGNALRAVAGDDTDTVRVLDALDALAATMHRPHAKAMTMLGRRPNPRHTGTVVEAALANAAEWADIGYPAGASGSSSGGGGQAWCDAHERGVDHCHRNGMDCRGQVIVSHDRIGDRLGVDQAALLGFRIRSRCEAAVWHIGRVVDEIERTKEMG